MKKVLSFALALGLSFACMAQGEKVLPAPVKEGGMGLFEVLQKRASVREYSDRALSDTLLSQVLWAACGKNRADGRITAPSAVNAQDVMVFVCRSDGAYLYDGQKNALTLVSSKDLRKAIAGRQSFAATAPVALVLVSDLNKLPQGNKMLGAMDAGYVSENICLACTALGLATVPRATMDHTVLTRELQLTENQELMLNNPIGYPAE